MANENIGADEARLNITWSGSNGDLPDPVRFDATDAEIRRWATEAVHMGGVPGIAADPEAAFQDFVIGRYAATEDVPYNRLVMHPKTPFGAQFTHCSKCGGEKDAEGWCARYCTDE